MTYAPRPRVPLGLTALLIASLGAACSPPAPGADATPGDGGMDAGMDAVAPDAPDAVADVNTDDAADTSSWEAGPHDPLPQVPNQGGPTIAHPALVVVTFADDPDRADHEANARWLVGSDWLRATGTEYGIGAGSVLGVVARTDNAPDTATDAQTQQLIADGIAAGTIPRPAGGDLSNVIYALYYPHHTTVTHPVAGTTRLETSCMQFGAYHGMAHVAGLNFAYLVVAGCSNLLPPLTQRQHAQFYLSHELIEAATDPDPVDHPAWQLPLGAPPSAWTATVGGEVGDLCTFEVESVTESGFVATRVWSNAAAAEGAGNPCVPRDNTRPYFNMSATPSYLALHAGELGVVTLRGWSDREVPAWTVSSATRGSFMPQLMVRSQMLNNGRSTQMGITVPAGTPPGSYTSLVVVADGADLGTFGWPVLVVVQ